MAIIDFSRRMNIGQTKGEKPVQVDVDAGNQGLDKIKQINNQALQGYKK